jgi:hypothetical protein
VKDEEDTSLPYNDVNFKIFMEAKHEGGHYFKVKYNWFGTSSTPASEKGQKPNFKEDTLDTGYMKDWNLVQIEGETPVQQSAEEDKSAPQTTSKSSKKPAGKDAKKAAAGALEEITDNRPREVNYTKNFAEEGVTATKGTEDFAKFFETFLFTFQIWKVERETQQESLQEECSLDLT